MAKNEADPKNAKRRAKFFKALGDESRQRMISLLAVKELCVCEVISALEMTQPTTSHHLGILEEANIVETRKDGKWVFYSLTDKEKIKQILQLVE